MYKTETWPAQAERAPDERVNWVDTAKGIGIILVVVGHAWRGIHQAGLIRDDALFRVLDSLIYAFHMPLFFFLAGIFFPPNLVSRRFTDFVWQRTFRLIYPLLLWTYAFALTKVLAGNLSNASLSWSDLWFWPLPPKWHFWFLWALFLIQMASMALRPLLVVRSADRFIWGAACLLVTVAYLNPWPHGSAWFNGALFGAPFFFLGAFLGRFHLPPPRMGRGWIAAAAVFVFALSEAAALGLEPIRPVKLLVGCSATLSLVTFVWATQSYIRFDWIGDLGRASMAIFLAHVIFSAATRIALSLSGIDDVATHLLFGTLVGLAGPLVLYHVAKERGYLQALGF